MMPYQQPCDVDAGINANQRVDTIRIQYESNTELDNDQTDGVPHEDVRFPFTDEQVPT